MSVFPLRSFAADSYNIGISAATTASSCHANGTLQIKLSGSDTTIFLFRSYSVAGDGSTYASTSTTFTNLSKGTYSVTVSGEVNGEYITRTTTATVGGSYVVPSASKVVGSDGALYGTRRTFSCRHTGQVQLQIRNGVFPYVVATYLGGAMVKSDTFKTRQSTGSSYSQDYNYYTIGSLGEGLYTFRVTDGCGYTMPEITERVEKLTADFSCYGIRQVSNSRKDSNVVAIDLMYTSDDELYKYSYEHRYRATSQWEYSLSYNGGAYTAWKDVPSSGIVSDTVKSATKYCDIWGKSYTVKVRVKGCTTESCSQTVTVGKPYYSTSQRVTQDDYTSCVKDTLLRCYNSSYLYYGYTEPLRIQLTNTATGVVLCDSVLSDGNTSLDVKITKALYNQTVRLQVTDKNSCTITNSEGVLYPSLSNGWYRYDYDYPCRHHYINIGTIGDVARGTAVELISSPDSNRLNFKAAYGKDNNTWSVTKSSGSTRSDVVSTYSSSITLSDTTLPSGIYRWVFTDDCGRNDTLQDNFSFYQYEVADSLHFTSRKDCEGMMYYPKGQIAQRIDGTGAAVEVATSFRVYGQAGGYRISNGLSEGYVNRDSLLITAPGIYVVEMTDYTYMCVFDIDTIVYSPINVALKDALAYVCLPESGAPSSLGKVIAKVDSSTGVAPYTFTLYAQENGMGAVLGTNQTGLFANVGQAGDKLSLRISDHCNASLVQNITVQSISEGGTKKIFSSKQVCLGAPLSLHGLLIGSGDIISYRWSGPNGFSATGKDVVVTQSTTAQHIGRYYLDIVGIECIQRDSIDIVIASFIEEVVADTICSGHDYSGAKFKPLGTASLAAGIYVFADTLRTEEGGCDSVVTLTLTIAPAYNIADTLHLCASALPYAYRDTLFDVGTASGTYQFGGKTAFGCDSMITLLLRIAPTYSRTDSLAICRSSLPYTYGETVFDANARSGIYSVLLKTKSGCDSLISLQLTINEAVKFSVANPGICADQTELRIEYKVEESAPTGYSLYFEQGQNFFTDIVNAPMAHDASSSLRISVPAGIAPNVYRAEIALSNELCASEKQAMSISVSYPSSIIAQKWNDVIATYNAAHNGGYEFTAFRWYKNGEEIPNTTSPTLYLTPALDFGSSYHVLLTRTDGVAMPCCPIVPQPRAESSVYPTLVRQNSSIFVYGVEQGEAIIRNIMGVPITARQAVAKGAANSIRTPAAASGIYFLELKFTGGGQHVIPIYIQ